MRGKNGAFALKLDMANVYNKLAWHFIHETLRRLGSLEDICSLIMSGIMTTSFFIILNGSLQGFFKPTRSMRNTHFPCTYSSYVLRCSPNLYVWGRIKVFIKGSKSIGTHYSFSFNVCRWFTIIRQNNIPGGKNYKGDFVPVWKLIWIECRLWEIIQTF